MLETTPPVTNTNLVAIELGKVACSIQFILPQGHGVAMGDAV